MSHHPAVAAWRLEHEYFNRLLHLLQEQVDVLYTGETPNYELMLDIIDYLRDYADQVHHPREDEAFRRLAQRSAQHRKVLQRLHQEHRVIAKAGENLRELLQQAENDSVVSRAEIEVAAATYLVYWGNHIAREEEEVLPAAEKLLTESDWAAARDAAPAMTDPLFGSDPQARFRNLRRRISSEAA
ncbi:hemerythrin domain-containing protein [Ramlibacter albus]|uniref:Hemerythrin domain-containing protein n=1 Tax=Ramlibacter albus TaxID=2079448 RepID=A0A923M933_9BURK|nr:hemerythrin domain-containing protein [Ramlibacter albus]MBC5765024.1 hemerythrin domain-containing protein [Ramlibacter albus]